jgi:hypothetical protein
MKAGMKGFILIKEFKIQYTLFPSHPPRKRRKDLYVSDSNDEEINKKINVEGIDGDEISGEKIDEDVNMEKNVEEIIKEIDRKVVRTRNNKKMKRVRISLPYHEEMEDRRIGDLRYRVKPKIARRRRG